MPRLALRATLRKKSVGAKSAPCGSRDGRPVSQTIFSGRLPLALFAVRGEGGAVLAQAGGGGGDAGDGGRTGGGTDTGAVEEVFVKRAIDYIWYINIKKVIYS